MFGIIEMSAQKVVPAMLEAPGYVTETYLGGFDMFILSKKCRQCGKTKPISEFKKNKASKNGIDNLCRECANEKLQQWRASHPEKTRQFNKSSHRKHYLNNTDVVLEKNRKWAKENQGKVRERRRKWADDNPEKMKHSKKKWLEANIEKMRQIVRVSSLKWAKNNPEKRQVNERNRRARKLGNGGSITFQEWEDLKKHYDYTCLACGQREPYIKLTIDHVLPLKLGGKNVIENSQPLCKSCNSKKGARYIDYRKRTA